MVQDNKNIEILKKSTPVIETLRPAKLREKTAISDRIAGISFSQVKITDRFWKDRLETNRNIT